MMQKEPTAYGYHACEAILKNLKREVTLLVIRKGDEARYQDLLSMAKERDISVKLMKAHEMNQQFENKVHQGVALWTKPVEELSESQLNSFLQQLTTPPFILILDGVTDPHNLGACLRTADAVGVDLVIAPKDKSVGITPVVAKVSSGASESVPFLRVTNLVRCIKQLQEQGIWVYGAAGEATESLYQLDGTRALALVLGAEGDGLRRLTRETCDGLYSIPMCGSVSSLNVSVASAVSLYEVRRQRG